MVNKLDLSFPRIAFDDLNGLVAVLFLDRVGSEVDYFIPDQSSEDAFDLLVVVLEDQRPGDHVFDVDIGRAQFDLQVEFRSFFVGRVLASCYCKGLRSDHGGVRDPGQGLFPVVPHLDLDFGSALMDVIHADLGDDKVLDQEHVAVVSFREVFVVLAEKFEGEFLPNDSGTVEVGHDVFLVLEQVRLADLVHRREVLQDLLVSSWVVVAFRLYLQEINFPLHSSDHHSPLNRLSFLEGP